MTESKAVTRCVAARGSATTAARQTEESGVVRSSISAYTVRSVHPLQVSSIFDLVLVRM